MAGGLNRLSFRLFVESQEDPAREKRDDLRKMHLLGRIIRRGGMNVTMVDKETRPYLFVASSIPGFKGGAKVYQEGDQIAYKYQSVPARKSGEPRYDSGLKKSADQYETARTLPMQQIFLDFQADSNLSETQVFFRMADELARRFKDFFRQMKRAKRENALQRDREDGDMAGAAGVTHVGAASGSDYGHSMDRPM